MKAYGKILAKANRERANDYGGKSGVRLYKSLRYRNQESPMCNINILQHKF